MILSIRTIYPLSFFLFLFLACSSTPQELTTAYNSEDVQVERLENVEILYSDSAQVRVRVTAPVMLRHLERSNAQQEFTEGILVEFIDDSNRVNGSLRANYGQRFETSQKVIVRDSVVWNSGQGEQLETEELTWNERDKKIITNKFVTITRPEEIIYGHGFEAEQDFSHARIKAVEGRIKLKE